MLAYTEYNVETEEEEPKVKIVKLDSSEYKKNFDD
jgi:hypothetical protein